MRRIIRSLALALALFAPASIAYTASPAAALNCPFTGANLSNSDFCADANFATGSGRVYVMGSRLSGTFYKIEVQTKTGTMGWVTRCSTVGMAPQYCSGSAGFATATNTLARVKAYRTSTNYAYYDLSVTQV